MNALSSILLGAGGHARVVLDAMRTANLRLPEYALDSAKTGSVVDGVSVAGGDELLSTASQQGITHFVLGIGGQGTSGVRATLWEKACAAGLAPLSVIHARAIVSESAVLGEGVQVLAGAIVNAGARVERGAILNTGCIVEHDCVVGEFTHVAPGSCLGGGVCLGSHCHIGLGAVVREYKTLGARTLVGAGAVVVADVPGSCRVVGVPAKAMQS